MEQRSDEWFSARKGRVTGSMVGAILGLDPNCTREEAMRRMVRAYQGLPSEFHGNIATQWGVTHEDEAREAMEHELGLAIMRAQFCIHPEHHWLGASPDGHTALNLVEIKCPFGIRKDQEPKFKSVDDQQHYYAQMQIQMFCTGMKGCYFYQWTPYGRSIQMVDFSQQWIDANLPKLHDFYQEFLVICDDDLEDIRPVIDTPRALQMVAEYNDLQDAISQAEDRKKELLENIVEMCGKRNAVFGGKKLTKIEKNGAISYAKAVQELMPDANLEKWRGKPSSYWMLK